MLYLLIADILSPLVDLDLSSLKDHITEQVLTQLQQAEESIQELGHVDTVISSLDVQALYPSLDQEEAAEAVSRFVQRTRIKVKGVNWCLAHAWHQACQRRS